MQSACVVIMGGSPGEEAHSPTLLLLLLRHRLFTWRVAHGGYGISEIGTGAGEQIDGMVKGAGLAPGSFAGLGASKGSRIRSQ